MLIQRMNSLLLWNLWKVDYNYKELKDGRANLSFLSISVPVLTFIATKNSFTVWPEAMTNKKLINAAAAMLQLAKALASPAKS